MLYIIIGFATFALMEWVAWFSHKYIMHGLLWVLHEDHHIPPDTTFQKNDWFALIFAVPSILLIFVGTFYHSPISLSIGIGILLYGLAYFFVHDIYVHRRINIFQHLDNTYLRALRIAHKMHHKHIGKKPGESFGFLWVGKKYWVMARERKH